MKLFRKVIFWCHLVAGVVAGLVILIMSVSGALLALEPQVLEFAERDVRSVRPPQGETQRLGPAALLARARQARPGLKPSGLTLKSDPGAAVSLALGREGVLYVNPYNGEVLGEGSKGTRAFFRVVEDWHRWLGANGDGRAVGRAVTGACNAAFLLLAVSGVYLWWPKTWSRRNLMAVTTFRRGLKGRARDFNWHNATGFWCALVLVLLTATGMVMSYQWANNLLYTLTGSPPPAPQAPQGGGPDGRARAETDVPDPDNLDQLWARAERQTAAWESITLRLPVRPGAPVSFNIREGGQWNPIASSQLTLAPQTAEVVRWEPYSGLSAGRRLRSWVRSTHTGEAGRLPGQIIAGLASLGGGLLVYTGFALAWRRFRKWLAKRRGVEGFDARAEDGLLSGASSD